MASKDVLVHLNMNGNEIQNVLAQKLATAPSNPSAGQFYFNTTDNTLYVYNGTSWLNALAQGTTYTDGTGIDITGNVISLDVASSSALGGVIVGANIGVDSTGTISVAAASTSAKGVIEIATDAEVTTGTDTTRAVTPKQLAGKVNKLATAPTAGTYAKVTINSDGLVTSGASLSSSDVTTALGFTPYDSTNPSGYQANVLETVKVNGTAQTITSKTVDITVPTNTNQLTNGAGFITTSAVGKADTVIQKNGVAIGTINANATEGSTINVTTTELTDISIASGSTNYLGYNSSNGQISAKVDTTVTSSSTKLVTSGAVDTAIKNAISTVYKASGSVAFASLPALGSSVEGNVYNVTDAFTTTSNFVEGAGKSYPAGTNVVCINTSGTTYKWDVLAASIDVSSFITASSTDVLTNKTIDADDNTISDLATGNFKSGVVVTTVGATGTDTSLPTEKAVRSAITTATSGMVTTSGNQTLTNKTIDADDNTISDLTTSNFKSGTVVTSIGATGTDAALPTEKAVRDALNLQFAEIANPALTPSGGVCYWNIGDSSGRGIYSVDVERVSNGRSVIFEFDRENQTIALNSDSNISAGTLNAYVIYKV